MDLKKRIAVITGALCLAGMAAACSVSAALAEKVAVNNDFEVNYDGWCASSHSMSLSAKKGMGYKNTRGMVVTYRKSASDGVWSVKGMYLSGGADYTYSAMVYSDTEETFHLSLSCADERGAEKSVPLANVKAEAGKWVKLTADYTAPAGSRNFKLSINTDSASDFRFDNIKVTTKDKLAKKASAKGLKDEFAGYFRVGNILNAGSVNNPEVIANVLQNYNSITCENETKPDFTLVREKCTDDNIAVSINNAAAIFDFCANNGISVRGHTLIWHSQTPSWFFKEGFKSDGKWVTPEVMDKRMESYIKNMFGTIKTQYPGLELYAYDVVNEAVSDDVNRTAVYGGAREPGDNNVSGGKSAWVQVYGDNSFIEKAFFYARKYAPEGCKLFYNDYNEYWDHKRDKIYAMCKNLYEKGLLDGVGMQSHVNADIGGFSGVDAHKEAMKKYLSIGCDVQITELDINCENGKFTDKQQAQKYEAIFRAAMECNNDPAYEGKVTAVCIWGPNDANTWISAENRPLLYDTNNKPKSAYTALTKMIPKAKWGDGSKPANADRPRKKINTKKTDGDAVTEVKVKEKSGSVNNSGKGGSYSDNFEKDSCGWSVRGSGEITLSKKAADGKGSLFVKGRTAAWNGVTKPLDPNEFAPGSTCSFSVKVMFENGGDTDTFFTKLQYVDGNGVTQYASVAEGAAKKGKWITLSNDKYVIPSDASDMQIYVETASSTNDFYIDSARGKVITVGK